MTTGDKRLDTSLFFEQLLKNSGSTCILLIDEQGIIREVNKEAESVLGYTREDLVCSHFSILFTTEDRTRKLPELEMLSVKRQNHYYDHSYIQHKNGSSIWVSCELIKVHDDRGVPYVIKIVQDNNRSKLLEQLLTESNQFVETVLETFSDPIVVLDNKYNILKCNTSFMRFFGLTDSYVIAKDLMPILRDKCNFDHIHHILQSLLTNGHIEDRFEEVFNLPGIGERVVSVSSKVLGGLNHGPRKILLVFRDITRRRVQEQRKDEFLSLVSHELKSPLASMKGFSQLLQQKPDGRENVMRYAQKIEKQTDNVSRLVSDLLDLSKLETGHLNLTLSDFELEAMVAETVEMVQLQYPSHKIEVKGEEGIVMNADRARVSQVLINLLTNAIKYSPNSEKVLVTFGRVNDSVAICVRDFGIGIPVEALSKIFDRYYRTGKTRKQFEGLGIGLYICNKIIKQHRGKLEVESEEGKGSRFCFTLPAGQGAREVTLSAADRGSE